MLAVVVAVVVVVCGFRLIREAAAAAIAMLRSNRLVSASNDVICATLCWNVVGALTSGSAYG